MPKYQNIREEELKNEIAHEYFSGFDCRKIIGNIDFCVTSSSATTVELQDIQSLLWAEAKKGSSDICKSIAQLILTIGKARTFDKYLPPAFLGAFDGEKMAFIPYNEIHDIFYQNDFNWNVAPSNYETKEFKLVLNKVSLILTDKTLLFYFDKDAQDLHEFVRQNFVVGKIDTSKIRIDKNNFTVIYAKWLQLVKPTIGVNWEIAQKNGIIDGDFYLADVLSLHNESIKGKLDVFLKKDHYEFRKVMNEMGFFDSSTTYFTDNQKAHTQFWNKYERPPKEEYWDYVVARRDLLVPQDVRERKGSFFTPQIWVELSQKYLADVLGEDWQDEYYIWDCAAGTGNLLAGLTNKYNIWASTLDRQDVKVMHDRIQNGANLLESHVFQFDFLNDDFTKLPKSLQDVINDPEKRKKLVVYINPPYAEHGNRTTILSRGEHKANVATTSKVYAEFNKIVGTATRELFVQFFLRIYKELPNSKIASFSTLKFINSQNFFKFRQYFQAEYKKGFICNANSFDNVRGNFPIGFLIWDLAKKQNITKIETVILLHDNKQENYYLNGVKIFYSIEPNEVISYWLRNFYDKIAMPIGFLILPGVDMQQQNGVYITTQPTESDVLQHKTAAITTNNIAQMCIYLCIRQCIEATWINNKDQFLYPNDGWQTDNDFQNNCLAFTLFHGQNKISSKDGLNHWLPFTAQEVNASERFESNFMTDFIKGKLKSEENSILEIGKTRNTPLTFSAEATAVFDAGRELWRYYHQQPNVNVNASLYDIKEYFQGRNDRGKMNSQSQDEKYMLLLGNLRKTLKILSEKIEPKIYEYGFLRK